MVAIKQGVVAVSRTATIPPSTWSTTHESVSPAPRARPRPMACSTAVGTPTRSMTTSTLYRRTSAPSPEGALPRIAARPREHPSTLWLTGIATTSSPDHVLVLLGRRSSSPDHVLVLPDLALARSNLRPRPPKASHACAEPDAVSHPHRAPAPPHPFLTQVSREPDRSAILLGKKFFLPPLANIPAVAISFNHTSRPRGRVLPYPGLAKQHEDSSRAHAAGER